MADVLVILIPPLSTENIYQRSIKIARLTVVGGCTLDWHTYIHVANCTPKEARVPVEKTYI